MCGFGLREAAAKLVEGEQRAHHAPAPPAPAPGPASGRVGTMLGVAVVPPGGIAPPQVAQPHPAQQQPTHAGHAPVPSVRGGDAAPTSRVGTMLGFAVVPEGSVAPPVSFQPAGPPSAPAAPEPPPAPPAPASAAASYGALRPSGTMGFAMPPMAAMTAPTAHATTPDAAPLTPRRMVAELVSRHGQAVLADPARCAVALVEDYQRQVSLLTAALERGVPQRLLAAASAQAPIEQTVAALSHELAGSLGIPQAGARWAVESWALAFQLLLPHPASHARA